jgi:hypothetical protein
MAQDVIPNSREMTAGTGQPEKTDGIVHLRIGKNE